MACFRRLEAKYAAPAPPPLGAALRRCGASRIAHRASRIAHRASRIAHRSDPMMPGLVCERGGHEHRVLTKAWAQLSRAGVVKPIRLRRM